MVSQALDWIPQQSFDALRESTKELIALSTGTIALTVTFSKDFVGNTSRRQRLVLVAAWIAYLCAIISGVMLFFAITSALADSFDANTTPTIYDPILMNCSRVQQVSFLVGTILAVIYATRLILNAPSTSASAPSKSARYRLTTKSLTRLGGARRGTTHRKKPTGG
jgi:hypothetical protein